MLAYGFTPKRWCAFSADDRFHVLADRHTTLCGIGWLDPHLGLANAATKADWTQCALCAHHVAQESECWGLNPDEADYTEEGEDGA